MDSIKYLMVMWIVAVIFIVDRNLRNEQGENPMLDYWAGHLKISES